MFGVTLAFDTSFSSSLVLTEHRTETTGWILWREV
jgi:hypothetical protein